MVVYSKTWCPYCDETKQTLSSLSIAYTAIELDAIDAGPDIQAELAAMTGQRTVPSVFVKGRHLGGNDDTQKAARSGALPEMLSAGSDDDGAAAVVEFELGGGEVGANTGSLVEFSMANDVATASGGAVAAAPPPSRDGATTKRRNWLVAAGSSGGGAALFAAQRVGLVGGGAGVGADGGGALLAADSDSATLRRELALRLPDVDARELAALPEQAAAITLLRAMARDSPDLRDALVSGRPTVIDFYADWCTLCREMAPRVARLERDARYGEAINFVTVDGGAAAAAPLVELFGVDGIPHLAFVSARGEVLTALIGLVPRDVLAEQFDALKAGTTLPYVGFDAFRARPEERFLRVAAPPPET